MKSPGPNEAQNIWKMQPCHIKNASFLFY